jgi:1,2-diacylglycerol 3-alpha-glucosyltransferase
MVAGAKRIRIAMVLDSWDDANNGAVVSTRRLSALLRERGHTVTIFASGKPAPHKVVLPDFRIPIFGDVMEKMRFRFAWPDRRILRQALASHDLLHVQLPFYLGIRAIGMARKAGVPVVSTFHVQAEHLLYNIGIRNQRMVDWVYRFFLWAAYNRSDHVVCPSVFAEEEIRRYGLRVPTTVISNGLPPEYRPIPRELWPNFGGKLVVLSVGRLAREKRQDLLIEAVRRSRYESRIQLVLIGAGPMRAELEGLGKSLTNPPLFLYLPPHELIPYYNAAELCVHAAEVEVECMSVLEAMGCGCPCLIARSPKSATSQFALSGAFLFQHGSLEELSQRLAYWLDRPEELRKAGRAYQRASEHYRIEVSLEKLLAVYGAVTSSRPRGVTRDRVAAPDAGARGTREAPPDAGA